MARPVVAELGNNDAGDNHGDQHDDGANNQDGLSADLVDDGHGGEGADEEDNTGDTSGQESSRAAGETEALEDVAGVVDDGVDTRPPKKT